MTRHIRTALAVLAVVFSLAALYNGFVPASGDSCGIPVRDAFDETSSCRDTSDDKVGLALMWALLALPALAAYVVSDRRSE